MVITADSGAADSVIPKGAIKSAAIRPNEASRRGMKFCAANSTELDIYGEQNICCRDDKGTDLRLRMTCADVKKPLASVMKIVKKGNRVVFDDNGSYVENKESGARTRLREEGGVYAFDVWMPAGLGHRK